MWPHTHTHTRPHRMGHIPGEFQACEFTNAWDSPLDFYQCHVQTCLTVRSTHDSSALTHLQHGAVKTRGNRCVCLPGGSIGHEGGCRGWRRPLWFGRSCLPVKLTGGGGTWLGGVSEATGGAAAAGGRVPVVTQVSQAGATRVTCAVSWGRGGRVYWDLVESFFISVPTFLTAKQNPNLNISTPAEQLPVFLSLVVFKKNI